jgi:peptidoglycan lytic transglycosylase
MHELDRGRPARQENFGQVGAQARRLGRRLRRAAALGALAALTLSGASAQAAPGGASPITAVPGPGLAFTPLRVAGATWYGPGLYGRHTACGQTLRPNTIGVANRTLPCGTAVRFLYHGRSLLTRVIDRGPYSRGNAWDLTNGARLALGFEGAAKLRYAVAISYARR